jgi:hypothetical protein
MPSVIRGSDGFDTAGGNAVKAWVNFNGTGTVAIRAAYNVTSITDNGVGDYTLNFTTALPDTTYTAVGSATKNGGYVRIWRPDTYATTSLRCTTGGGSGSYLTSANDDSAEINVAIFR